MLKGRKRDWRRLDNAAKIFPATSCRNDTRVFRFACELKEEVEEEYLQKAAEETLLQFPSFRCVLRTGAFWYYLEDCNLTPIVHEENTPLCDNLYIRNQKTLLFDISYYKKRINFEVYHALTDGTGAMCFLKILVCRYLKLVHAEELKEAQLPEILSSDVYQQSCDSFNKFYDKHGAKGHEKESRAYQLKDTTLGLEEMKLIEGVMSVKQVHALAKEYHTTITAFLTAVFFSAIEREMSVHDKKYPVYLMIPVNLRNYYPSTSLNNFFGWIDIYYKFQKDETPLSEVVDYVNNFFKNELTPERVAMRMNELVSLEKYPIARFSPIFLKTLVLIMAKKMAGRKGTAIYSNIGKVVLPEEYAEYIRLFDVFVSTSKLQICMCSYQDNLVASFTSKQASNIVVENFFRILSELGVEIEISAHIQEDR